MLRSYTDNQKYVEVSGKNLIEALNNLDLQYRGIKFRFINENDEIRPHMRVYVNSILCEKLDIQLAETDEIFITQSLSGGVTVSREDEKL